MPDEITIASIALTSLTILFVISPDPHPKSKTELLLSNYSMLESIIINAVTSGSDFDLLET
jgi:hypothetical protein